MRRLALAAACVLWAMPAAAHPHVFIDNMTTFVFAQGRIAAVKLHWTFDELFSASIVTQFDKNKDKKFDKDELAALEKGAFANLQNFNYFIWLAIDGTDMPVKRVTDFTAAVEGDKLVYEFIVPIVAPVDPLKQRLVLGVYDPEFFVDVEPGSRDSVRYEGNGGVACRTQLVEGTKPIYGGQILPNEMHLTCAAAP